VSKEMLDNAISEKLIDEEYHSQLLLDVAGYTRMAGIPERFVWSSLTEYCTNEAEVRYVIGLKQSLNKKDTEIIGMVYLGTPEGASVHDRMMSIAGACLRNYLNAKVMTVQDVISALKSESMPTNVSVLLIPNFFIGKDQGGHIANWEISSLLGMLYKREQEGRHTVLYVSDQEELLAQYGDSFAQHIAKKFVQINAPA
jgi:hypothetical protein